MSKVHRQNGQAVAVVISQARVSHDSGITPLRELDFGDRRLHAIDDLRPELLPCADLLEPHVPRVQFVDAVPGESSLTLQERVTQMMSELERSKLPLGTAVLLARAGFSAEDLGPTAELLRPVVGRLAASGGGTLCLVPSTTEMSSGRALAALGFTLQEQVRSAGVDVLTRRPRGTLIPRAAVRQIQP